MDELYIPPPLPKNRMVKISFGSTGQKQMEPRLGWVAWDKPLLNSMTENDAPGKRADV